MIISLWLSGVERSLHPLFEMKEPPVHPFTLSPFTPSSCHSLLSIPTCLVQLRWLPLVTHYLPCLPPLLSAPQYLYDEEEEVRKKKPRRKLPSNAAITRVRKLRLLCLCCEVKNPRPTSDSSSSSPELRAVLIGSRLPAQFLLVTECY